MRCRFHGLRAGPQYSGSVTPLAPNSGVLVLPKITRPASRNRWVIKACRSATSLASDRDPDEVGKPWYSWSRSLIRNGTPANLPCNRGSAACRSATSSRRRTIAFNRGLTASARWRARARSSAGVTCLRSTSSARAVASRDRYSSSCIDRSYESGRCRAVRLEAQGPPQARNRTDAVPTVRRGVTAFRGVRFTRCQNG
ncbi:hypothetical protein I547_6854 [Mycobacterium kansasii 824]|nr:hypothetical protein I547_6854 [Mycobacterium kansasii 824]